MAKDTKNTKDTNDTKGTMAHDLMKTIEALTLRQILEMEVEGVIEGETAGAQLALSTAIGYLIARGSTESHVRAIVEVALAAARGHVNANAAEPQPH